jgi:hypothetical protein
MLVFVVATLDVTVTLPKLETLISACRPRGKREFKMTTVQKIKVPSPSHLASWNAF